MRACSSRADILSVRQRTDLAVSGRSAARQGAGAVDGVLPQDRLELLKITSMFMPRVPGDPVPAGSKNLAFVSQFVALAGDVVFTVEYPVRAAQVAVYELLHIDRKMPPVTRHDRSVRAELEALAEAFKWRPIKRNT